MGKFYEVYKTLISFDMFHEGGSPHVMVTGIDFNTQKTPHAVSFDYQKVYDREDEYKDVVGFYHTHPAGLNEMSAIDIETMTQWVQTLGKSLVCLIETNEKVNGWLFYKTDSGVDYREVKAITSNDVHYDVWIDPENSFWNPVDFLRDGEFTEEEGPDFFEEFREQLNRLENAQSKMNEKVNLLVLAMKEFMSVIKSKR